MLFLDTLRVRANNMLAHEQAGLPPLLNFDYETILDARRFEHPANYALLRITGAGGKRMEECVIGGRDLPSSHISRAGNSGGVRCRTEVGSMSAYIHFNGTDFEAFSCSAAGSFSA